MKTKTSRSKQLNLIPTSHLKCFGGSRLPSNPKSKRPLSTKNAIHLVLKSRMATGNRSMLQKANAAKVDSVIRRNAKNCGVRIYQLVNVGNHLHLVVRIQSQRLFSHFLRAVSGLIARHILKKERGQAKAQLNTTKPKQHDSFWVARPFTRLIAWGTDFRNVKRYMDKNRGQARSYFVAWGFDQTEPVRIFSLSTA